MSFEGLQFTEKELYCRAFHETFSDIFETPFKYSLVFEFSSAATCRRWVFNSSEVEVFQKFQSRRAPSQVKNVPMPGTDFFDKYIEFRHFSCCSTRDTLQKWFQHRRFTSNFKSYRENSQETFAAETVFSIFMEDILEISNCLNGTLLKTLF